MKEIQTEGIINGSHKPLITSSSGPSDFSILQDDLCITPQVDIAVIHTGTNDLQNNCNIVKKAKKLANSVKEIDKDNSVKIAISNITNP